MIEAAPDPVTLFLAIDTPRPDSNNLGMRRGLGFLFFLLPALAAGAEVRERVLVRMRDPGPQSLDVRSSSSRGVSRAEQVVAIQRAAEKSQKALLSDLLTSRVSRSGDPRDIRTYWITPSVALSATPAEVEALAKRPDVAEVLPLRPLPPPRTRPGAEVAREGRKATWGLEALQMLSIRRMYGLTGKGVVIGHLDTGVHASHPDLAGKVLRFKDFTEDHRPEPYDNDGHGTHTAGTLVGGDASGMAIGIAPDAKLISAKVFSSAGADPEGILEAMQWILDPDGDPATDDAPRVISNSWGSDDFEDRVFWDATKRWIDLGIFPLFATGNTGQTAGVPAAYPFSFSVGAVNADLSLAGYSSRGPVKWDGKSFVKPQIVGPGTDTLSAWPVGNGYSSLEGTSMACPHVAGIAALMLEAKPGITSQQMQQILLETAMDLGAAGEDDETGRGMIDAAAALGRLAGKARVEGRLLGSEGRATTGRLWIPELELEARTDASGGFVLHLPAGRFTLVGRTPDGRHGQDVIEITSGQSLKRDLSLGETGAFAVTGTVRARAGGAALEATVVVLSDPARRPGVKTDPVTGAFRLQVPVGRHTLMVTAPGHEPSILDNRFFGPAAGSGELEVALETRADVLIVDDDQADRLEKYYLDAFEDSGLTASTWDTRRLGPVPAEVLATYPRVIWQTGFDYRTAVTPEEQALIETYLTSGGNLWLAGQVAGVILKDTNLFSKVLHASWNGLLRRQQVARIPPVHGTAGDPIGDGLELPLNGDGSQDNQNFPSMIGAADDAATVIFQYHPEVGPAGIRVDGGTYRAVYTGFGIEGLRDAAARRTLLTRIMTWLEHGAEAPRAERRSIQYRALTPSE